MIKISYHIWVNFNENHLKGSEIWEDTKFKGISHDLNFDFDLESAQSNHEFCLLSH